MLEALPAPAAPHGLLVELLDDPNAAEIADPHPELGWIVAAAPATGYQTAYRIQVASSAAELARGRADLWDSGRVEDSRSLSVSYAGAPLSDRSSYSWRVRTWGDGVEPSPWSDPQEFRTGELSAEHSTAGYPLRIREVECAALSGQSDGSTFCDFGRAAFGTVRLTLRDVPEACILDLHFGEALESPGRVSRAPGGTVRYRNVKLPVTAGTGTYVVEIPPDRRNTGRAAIRMPEAIGEVLPFRYLELHGSPVALEAGDVRMLAVEYPFDDGAASFRSSDPRLDRVYEFCRYSIRATTFAGLYVDGDRERIPYEADAYINQLGHYAVDREYAIARRTHEYLLTHATWPTEWLLHSVLMAGADLRYTGDTESAARWYATLEHKALGALAGPDGLLRTRSIPQEVLGPLLEATNSPRLEDIVDWPAGERDGFVFTDVNAVVNAFHYQALRVLAELATALDRHADAAGFLERAGLVRESFNARFFDAERGVYVDGVGTEHASLHANMLPLAFGLVPAAHVESVADFVEAKGMACSVYGAQYLLEALFRAGRAEAAIALMTADHDRSWLHMLDTLGSTITLEAWDPRYKPNLDWNHAWGAAPANVLPRFVAGVRPLEPGFGRVRIQPQLGGLRSVEAAVPTVRGPVEVRIERGVALTLDVTLPGNMTAELRLPVGAAPRSLTVDGVERALQVSNGHAIVPNLGPGRHRLVLE